MSASEEMRKQAAAGVAANDLDGARQVFYHLSRAVIDLHSAFGHADDQNYYLTFCPMANDNKGAFWLQTVDTVYNSFYGASMLRCGEIKETLAAEVEKGD